MLHSHSIAQTVISKPVAAPVINDDGFVGEFWYEDFYPYSDALPITISARANDQHQEVQADTAFPIVAGDRGMLLGMLSYNYGDQIDSTTSIGLAYGFIFNDDISVRLSAHGDFTESLRGGSVEQFSIGFDVYTGWGIDVYGNYYFPTNEQFVTGEFSETVGGEQVLRWEDPFAERNQIVQQQFLDTSAFTASDFEFREQAMEGGDLGVTFDIPLLCEILDLPAKGNLGVYNYEGVFGNDDITGMQAGIQFYPSRGLSLGAQYYQDEELYGDKWLFHGGVTLAMDNVFSPRSWGRAVKTAFSPRPTCRQHGNQMARFLTPSRRKVTPTMGSSDAILVNQQVTAASTVLNERKVLLDDVVFVNNGGAVGNGIASGSASGNGTAENPFSILQDGANAAAGNGNIYVQATGTTYAGVTTNTTGQLNFVSSFKPIAACGGLTFGGINPGAPNTLTPPFPAGAKSSFGTVGGALVAGGITIGGAGNSAVEGFNVTGGINFTGTGTGLATCNIADEVTAIGMTNVTVTENYIVGAADDAIQFTNITGTAIANNNLIVAPGARGIDATNVSNLVATNNDILDAANDGIRVQGSGAGSVMSSLIIENNNIVNAGIDGIDVNFTSGDTLVGGGNSIDFNCITNTGGFGIRLRTDNTSIASVDSIDNNFISGAVTDGVRIDSRNTSVINLNSLSLNEVIQSGNDGIEIFAANTSTQNITSVLTNTIDGAINRDGIRVGSANNGTINLADLSFNIINNVDDEGIGILAAANSNQNIGNIFNNQIGLAGGGIGRDGIRIQATNGSTADIVVNAVSTNQIANSGQDGIRVLNLVNGGSLLINSFDTNTVTSAGTRGIFFRHAQNGATVPLFTTINGFDNNTVNGSGSANLQLNDSGNNAFTINGTAPNSGSGGSLVFQRNGNTVNQAVNNIDFFLNGTNVQSSANGPATANF